VRAGRITKAGTGIPAPPGVEVVSAADGTLPRPRWVPALASRGLEFAGLARDEREEDRGRQFHQPGVRAGQWLVRAAPGACVVHHRVVVHMGDPASEDMSDGQVIRGVRVENPFQDA